MKNNYLLIVFLLVSFLAFSQEAKQFEWVKGIQKAQGYSNGNIDVAAMDFDGDGNVYLTGTFSGGIDFDPSNAQVIKSTTNSSPNFFVAKYSSDGVLDFVHTGEGLSSSAIDIKVTGINRFFILGEYTGDSSDPYVFGSYDDGGGCATLEKVSSSVSGVPTKDFFIAKFNFGTYCDLDWVQTGGTNGDITASALTVDASNNVYITGSFNTTTTDISTTNLTNTGAGNDEVFLAKYNSSGTFQWAKSFGGSDNDKPSDITTDGTYLYVFGTFEGTANFQTGVGTSELTAYGSKDLFMAKYSCSSGAYSTKRQIGGASGVPEASKMIFANNYIYITANFSGTIDVNPGSGVTNLTSAGNQDMFFGKYNKYFSTMYWSKQITSTGDVLAKNIFLDSSYNLYIVNDFQNTADMDPGSGTKNLVSAGGYDVSIAKYDASGLYVWAKNIGGTNSENGSAIYYNEANSSLYTFGNFIDRCDFDPGPDVYEMQPSSYGAACSYILKLGNCDEISISPQPVSTTVCEGEALTLNVGVSQGTNPRYQWYKSGVEITGETNPDYTISNVALSDADSYTCMVTSSCADAVESNSASITVNQAPYVNSSPSNSTICEGLSTSFSVNAGGTGLIYQWLVNSGDGSYTAVSNNTIYSGATTATLSLSNVPAYMSYYQYKCVISGTCSPDAISNSAILVVNPNTTVTVNPTNTSVCETNGTTFSVSGIGAALNYQWKVSTNNGSSWSNLSDAGQYSGTHINTLSISNVSYSQNGNLYKCEISGTCGSNDESNSASLTVREQAALTSQPSNVEECEYADVTYSINATGYNLEYQWQVNSGSGWTNLSNGGAYANVSNSTLNINDIATSLSGNQYRCLVSSACSANIYSNAATLTVSATPDITINSSNGEDICQGENTVLSLSGGNANYTYQWRKNYSDLTGSNASSLSVNQSGAYSVYAENSIGCSSESDPVTINVHALPNATITVIGNNEFCEGNYAELMVPSGNGYSYQWYNNASLIASETSNSMITTISGNYHAVVNNTYGCESTSGNEIITVNPLPTVGLSPSNIEICQGETGTITATNNTDYYYQWKQNNLNISGENYNTIDISENGMYNVSVINSNTGCTFTSSYVNATVNALPTPEIQASGSLTYCVADQIDLSLTESYTNYLWQDAYVNSVLAITDAGTYSVTVTDANGCQNTDELEVAEELVPTPNICMVTVDTTVNKNLIVWENLPNVTGIASYNIYKLVNSSYQLLGNILYNDTTEFVDMTSEPTIHSDKYAIASVDSCGNIGAYSPYHQTMNLSIVDGSGDAISLIWTKYIDEAGINNPSEYEIYRGVNNLSYFASITGGLSDYNYNIPTTQENERFWIIVQRPMGCSPLNNNNKASGGPYYQSSSNIEDEGVVATTVNNITVEDLTIFPNPMQDFTVIKSDKKINTIRIFNVAGELIRENLALNTNTFKIDRKELSVGTYILEINGSIHQKLMVK